MCEFSTCFPANSQLSSFAISPSSKSTCMALNQASVISHLNHLAAFNLLPLAPNQSGTPCSLSCLGSPLPAHQTLPALGPAFWALVSRVTPSLQPIVHGPALSNDLPAPSRTLSLRLCTFCSPCLQHARFSVSSDSAHWLFFSHLAASSSR